MGSYWCDSLLVLINYLSLMVVAPGSIPTFRWIKNITQYGRLNRMNQEEYVSERELKESNTLLNEVILP